MTQRAQITGTVEYRLGDGVTAAIRPGPVQVHTTPIDATLSWSDGQTRSVAAIPIADFRNYVARGAIELQDR